MRTPPRAAAKFACAAASVLLLALPVARPAYAQGTAAAPAAPVARLDIGETRALEILPLVDWNVARPGLRGEAGVSYLVRTDRATILFDVGGNLEKTDPSPLVANMRELGVSLAEVDTVVISHAHMDHVGGQASARAKTFSLGTPPVDLAGKRILVPEPMTYPGAQPEAVRSPAIIAAGVATIGPITGSLFIGPIAEQALAFNVQGKGIVLLVGCGHQGLAAVLERTRRLFDAPLVGIVGGLHYPVPHGRAIVGGIDTQRFAAWGPFGGLGEADVQREIGTLAGLGLQWVSLSPHDSSDETIEAFRKVFGDRYHDLRVGESQVIGAARQ